MPGRERIATARQDHGPPVTETETGSLSTRATRYGIVIAILCVASILVVTCTLALPWYEVRYPGGERTSYYMHHYELFSSSPYSGLAWYGLTYDHSSDVGRLMDVEYDIIIVYLLLSFVYLGAVLAGSRYEGVFLGLVTIALLIAAAIYFVYEIWRVLGTGSFIGEAKDETGTVVGSWGPLAGWIYIVFGCALQSLAVALRTYVVARELPP